MDELTLADYLAIFKRQKKYFFLTFFVLWAISIVFALCWSNYRSTATVEIDQPEIATDMTKPTGSNENDSPNALADLRIDRIEQKVTAPASLVEIITKFNLYPDARRYTSMANLANKMRDKVKLTLISSEVANPAAQQKISADQLSAIAFNLSFDYSDPQLTQQVADELITRFLDEDLKDRRAQAKATSGFLGAQITALEASMAEQEKKIAEFQEAHGDSRPEALMFKQQSASSLAMSIQNLDSQITANEGTQGSLRAQLASVDPYSRVIADGQVLTTPRIQLKALEAQYATLTAQYGPDYPDVVRARHQIASLKAQIGEKNKIQDTEDTAQLKAQILDVTTNLKGAEETYGSDNPDVISLKDQLQKLQEQLAKQKQGTESNSAIKEDADNPAYLELVAQFQSIQEQAKSLHAQRDTLQKQLEKSQQALAENPGLEQQMAALSRDYDNAQLRYRDLKEKKMAADMEEQMEEDKKGQRLVVINPPELPLKTHPSRLMLILAGFALSCMAGVGSVILVHISSNSILGVQSLAALVGVPPMVSVPYIITEDELAHRRCLKPYFIGTVVFVLIIFLIVFHIVIMPLDVLWSVIFQRLGLS